MLFWLLVIDLIYDETLYVSLAEGILISVRNLYPCRGYYDFCQKLNAVKETFPTPYSMYIIDQHAHKVYIFLIGVATDIDLAMSVCPSVIQKKFATPTLALLLAYLHFPFVFAACISNCGDSDIRR